MADETELTEAELRERLTALERENSMLKAALNASPAGIIVSTLDGSIQHWNPAVLGVRGATAVDLNLSPIEAHPSRWQTFHPDGTPYRPEDLPLSRAILKEETCFGEDFIILDHTGIERWVSGHSAPIYDKGELIGGVVVFPDITDRKKAELELERFRKLAEASPDFIGMSTPDGRSLYVNPAGRRLCGLTDSVNIRDLPIASFHTAASAERILREGIPAVMKTGTWQAETELRSADGTIIPVAQTLMIHRNTKGEPAHLSTVMHDLRAIRQLEKQLGQSQRLESIGRLAGGIAHDFNNMLTVISNYAIIVRGDLPEEDPGREDLGQVILAGQRAAELCQQLLGFARRQIIQPAVLHMPALVEELTRLFRRTLGEDVILTTEMPDGLWPIRGDRSQLDQILMNLVVNARDAMPDGGELVIEAKNAILDEHYAETHPEVVPGEYLMIAVSDTGQGMPSEVQERIFEPFFTTKTPERGTGLGLSTVHGAVRQNGGHIWLYSEPGRGTSFKIYWPRGEVVEQPSAPEVRPQRVGKGTLLVVEDERMLRRLTVRLLKSGGYEVIEAADGPTALELARDHDGIIDALITDVIMPRMNGKVLSETLKEARPDVRVLFVSGYTENTIVHHGVLKPNVEFLAKPFTRAELLGRVQDLLA